MTIRLYNTRTRAKEVFAPLDPKAVRLYVCGPTVYDDAHIGNARPVIVFDLLYRLLRHTYGEEHVTYARNITDLDDKINVRAHERGVSIRTLTEETNARFQAACRALGTLEPTHQPRATDHIEGMKALIERLVQRGHAYVAEDHVLFAVPSMKTYGGLSRRPLEDMIAGARVDVAPYKRSEMDFVLWKPSRAAHEPGWDSPCGIAQKGRPGWHIECSAMSMAKLLEPFGGGLSCDDPMKNAFDIHGGGIDLMFPHHENEVAQSCCALGTDVMANVWMHNGFLQVEGQKMSKSLGNFITIDQLLSTPDFGGRRWSGDVLRLAMLTGHYRQPLDWTVKRLEEAEATLRQWSTLARGQTGAPSQALLDALHDDLNTALALAELHRLAKSGDAEGLAGSLAFIGLSTPIDRATTEVAEVQIRELVEARLAARRAKDFTESDRLRDQLLGLGITVKDGKDPLTGEPATTWEVKR